MAEIFKVTPRSITENFSPAWFAATMGTAVIPLSLSFIDSGWIKPVSAAMLTLSLILFILSLFPWLARFFLYPAKVRADLNHPVAANFFPTMPISLILFALNLMKFPTWFCSTATSHMTALILWGLGTTGIYLMGYIILLHIFRHKEINLQHANFGWYIPPVSKLLIPVAGFELAGIFPHYNDLIITVSAVSFGVGLFLFLFVGAAVYHRYIYHELPMSRFAATFFIGIAPPAIIAVILFKMLQLIQHHSLFGIDLQALTALAAIGIVLTWGFAAWWHIMSVLIILYYLSRIDLPYALSWWAFTFPSGALCVASGVAWKTTGSSVIHGFYLYSVFFFIIVWIIVFLLTIRGALRGKIFAPAH